MIDFQIDVFVGESDDAWGCMLDGKLIWFPKSECEFDEDDMTISVPEWLAENEGLI